MLKICHFTSSFPRNKDDSAGIFVKKLATQLSDKCKEYVLAPDSYDTLQKEYLGKVIVHRFQYFFKNFQKLAYDDAITQNLKKNILYYFLIPFFLVASAINLIKICKIYKIDIVHAHWILPQGTIAVLLRMIFDLDYKLILTAHGGSVYSLKGKLFYKIKQWTVNHCDIVTSVSEDVKNTMH